jgi:hypothetical protein
LGLTYNPDQIHSAKERGWFDIPMVYNNNRCAILAMEKGAPDRMKLGTRMSLLVLYEFPPVS